LAEGGSRLALPLSARIQIVPRKQNYRSNVWSTARREGGFDANLSVGAWFGPQVMDALIALATNFSAPDDASSDGGGAAAVNFEHDPTLRATPGG